MLTHAAYTTGKYTHGYVGLIYSRMEIGVPIFFVLSGFLLFSPWVRAVVAGTDLPSVGRYAWHRVRRIMPAYVITVLAAYLLYHFRTAGPNPGHTWVGLFRNLTLTQIYTDHYLFSFLHQGLTQMWSLAVEVAFYVALPVLAYVLLVVLCRRQWHPVRLVLGLVALAVISPAWLVLVHTTHFLPDGAPLWLPTYLSWFLGGMLLAALLPGGEGVRNGVRSAGARLLLHRVDPDRRRADHVAVRTSGGAGQVSVLRGDLDAGGGPTGVVWHRWSPWLVCVDHGEQAAGVPRRDLL
jgi:peptidoglycan/LPS O-acetylase OafA/YrhL